jgi:leucyl/phenylalanyl-tRNA---protein transferase
VTFDQDFAGVVAACAEPRPGRMHLTWIRPDIVDAYTVLHEAGYAHSVEVWDKSGQLAGGVYGVAIGKASLPSRCSRGRPTRRRSGSSP